MLSAAANHWSQLFFKIYFLAVPRLPFCMQAFSSSGGWGPFSNCSAQASLCTGLSCCRVRALGHLGLGSYGTRAQQSWHRSWFAPRHMASSQTRDWTDVPCTVRWTLNHWNTRKACCSQLLRKTPFHKPRMKIRLFQHKMISVCSRIKLNFASKG